MSSKYEVTFPFLPILCLIFITLKLTGYIAWSWWWVLSPILIPIGIICVGLAIGAGVSVLVWTLKLKR